MSLRFRKFLLVLCCFFSCISAVLAQDDVKVSGHVKDARNGEEIISASVQVKGLSISVSTNSYGFFALKVPKGKHTLIISMLGYETVNREIEAIAAPINLEIELKSVSRELKGFTVKETRKNKNVEKVEIGTVQVNAATIKKIPAVLGEIDVIKAIQLLPGVSTVGEGATGFNVRGGSVDQNLVLQDEAPVYNSSHALGFFSVFNPDAVKDVKLIKGGIPAMYGGRLSSVLDIRMKDGNMKKFQGSGGIGTIFSRLMFEGPLKKNKASFMLAARRSYVDAFFPLFPNDLLQKSKLAFTDLNAKVNYIVDRKNRLYLSAYSGRDVFGLADLFKVSWGNDNVTARWNHIYNSTTFANYSFIFSNYDYNLGATFGPVQFKWVSNIRFYNIKADHQTTLNNKHVLQYGANIIYYTFRPGETQPVPESQVQLPYIALEKKYAIEPAAYISDEWKVSRRFSMQPGIRYNGFANLGKSKVYKYANEDFRSGDNVTDTLNFKSGELVKYYHGLEPRLAFKYTLDSNSSVKGGYNRMRQNIHLITNTSAATPFDIYLPSDYHFKPQIADQVSLGYFRNFSNNMFETSVEVYYKTFNNLIDFKDGSSLIANERLDTVMLRGSGKSRGIEFFIRKTEGKLTGWISYTLSHTDRTVAGINFGKTYDAPFNKTHVLSVTLSYDITKRLSVGGNFIYNSGIAITVNQSRFPHQGFILGDPSMRNSYHIPDYHRADISLTWKGKKKKLWQGEWVLSAYNVYARRNAYSIYFRQNADNPNQTEAVKISVFGTILPSLTYNFTF